MNISKKLVESVLGYKNITSIRVVGNNICTIRKNDDSVLRETHNTINIYELAYKCKEWAVNLSPNKHALSSYPRWGDIRNYKKTNGSYYICQHLVSGAQFEAETEPEAVFKACEWILNEIIN